ncbi:hypothetical protein DFQ27_004401 [Actinomortierella ambigua]|uniref:Uncharacterized protein n=1 Tax=Actinomortierella ambigua TaxID=1343610 RepID=A0A9P6U4L3_9FUNG|nr:hypothetical protein DFQ27_004401 [Actinomortierella ambigua]
MAQFGYGHLIPSIPSIATITQAIDVGTAVSAALLDKIGLMFGSITDTILGWKDKVTFRMHYLKLERMLVQERLDPTMQVVVRSEFDDLVRDNADRKVKIDVQDTMLATQTRQLATQTRQLATQTRQLADQKRRIADQRCLIAAQKRLIVAQKRQFTAQKRQIAHQQSQLQTHGQQIEELQRLISTFI